MIGYRISVPSTVDAIYHALSDDIFSLNYPPDQKISETALALRYGVSRNTVREAIAALIQTGILIKVPNRGIFIKKISLDDVHEIFHLRQIFETEAILRISSTGFVLSTILDALWQLEQTDFNNDWAKYVVADSFFHSSLVNAVGSERLSRMYDAIAYETMLCISQSREILETCEDTDDHHLIIRYLQDGKANEAASVLTRHLKHAVYRFERAFSQRKTVDTSE